MAAVSTVPANNRETAKLQMKTRVILMHGQAGQLPWAPRLGSVKTIKIMRTMALVIHLQTWMALKFRTSRKFQRIPTNQEQQQLKQ